MFVYSESLDEMVIRAFRIGRNEYEWNDRDCVYYNIITDEDFYLLED